MAQCNAHIGEAIIDAIIKGSLLHASCPDSPESGCIVAWSANAAEQLAQLAIELVKENVHD